MSLKHCIKVYTSCLMQLEVKEEIYHIFLRKMGSGQKTNFFLFESKSLVPFKCISLLIKYYMFNQQWLFENCQIVWLKDVRAALMRRTLCDRENVKNRIVAIPPLVLTYRDPDKHFFYNHAPLCYRSWVLMRLCRAAASQCHPQNGRPGLQKAWYCLLYIHRSLTRCVLLTTSIILTRETKHSHHNALYVNPTYFKTLRLKLQFQWIVPVNLEIVVIYVFCDDTWQDYCLLIWKRKESTEPALCSNLECLLWHLLEDIIPFK